MRSRRKTPIGFVVLRSGVPQVTTRYRNPATKRLCRALQDGSRLTLFNRHDQASQAIVWGKRKREAELLFPDSDDSKWVIMPVQQVEWGI